MSRSRIRSRSKSRSRSRSRKGLLSDPPFPIYPPSPTHPQFLTAASSSVRVRRRSPLPSPATATAAAGLPLDVVVAAEVCSLKTHGVEPKAAT